MDKQSWSKPVKFEPGTARFRTIMNTKKTANFLPNYWPADGGEIYLKARQVCIEVLSGPRPPDDALTAFIKAAQRAAILVKR
jgi:hypothetical protein